MPNSNEVERKLSQMFMVGIPGTELVRAVEEFLREFQPGGILFFAHNYESPALITEFTGQLQDLTHSVGCAQFFLAVDQEGGKVQNFGKPFTHFPEAAVLGEIDSPKLAFDVADVVAKELMSVGINLNFWPLCDIHTRANNPIIGRRAFGTEEEIVSKISSGIVRGFVKNGMVSCVKHFPGHGDTTVDSHKALPFVDQTWDELMQRELKPFVRAIRAKVDMFMMAHIMNPQLDEIYPASISFSTISQHLRKELRFNKIVIADDMQMDAISDNFNESDVVALAINAGCDILIYRDMEQGKVAIETARRHLRDGRISEERINESYNRIMEVKKRVLPKFPKTNIEELRKIIGCESHQAILRAVQEQHRSIRA